jgi:hypothetical protein
VAAASLLKETAQLVTLAQSGLCVAAKHQKVCADMMSGNLCLALTKLDLWPPSKAAASGGSSRASIEELHGWLTTQLHKKSLCECFPDNAEFAEHERCGVEAFGESREACDRMAEEAKKKLHPDEATKKEIRKNGAMFGFEYPSEEDEPKEEAATAEGAKFVRADRTEEERGGS